MIACLVTLVLLAVVGLMALRLPDPELPPDLEKDKAKVGQAIEQIASQVLQAVFWIVWWLLRGVFWVFCRYLKRGFMACLAVMWVAICVDPPWLEVVREIVWPLVRLILGDQNQAIETKG